ALGQSEVAVVREIAREMTQRSANEASAVVTTAARALSVFSDPEIAQATSSSDFDLNDLQNGDTPVTLYLVSDLANAKRAAPVFRALLSAIIQTGVSRQLTFHKDSWLDDYPYFVPPYRHKLLLLLDDYARLEGGVPGLSEGLAFMDRGYGLQSFITVQNVDQLKALGSIATDSRSLVARHIRVFLRPADMETAEYISNCLPTVGMKTVLGTRPWMSPDEILQMTCANETRGSFPCITFRAGNAPVLGEVVPYRSRG
ncbi:type IV secretory system conjugative DNA transfer family protein, partial [Acidithiobacillus ferrooxidans]|nr:type IV secretory system conjugative DNA transfer family protein [Acidithiobacillus ferrooxidans]